MLVKENGITKIIETCEKCNRSVNRLDWNDYMKLYPFSYFWPFGFICFHCRQEVEKEFSKGM